MADGVYMWRDQGIDAGALARQLALTSQEAVRSGTVDVLSGESMMVPSGRLLAEAAALEHWASSIYAIWKHPGTFADSPTQSLVDEAFMILRQRGISSALASVYISMVGGLLAEQAVASNF